MKLWKRGLYLTCEKQSGHSSEVWQLDSPICYHVNTSQQPTLASSSVPPHLPDAPPLKGWKVGRCLREQQGASGVRFLWGQALSVFWVEGEGLEGWGGDWEWGQYGWCPAQEIDGATEQQSHLINFIYGHRLTATPAWGGHNQLSWYYPPFAANP